MAPEVVISCEFSLVFNNLNGKVVTEFISFVTRIIRSKKKGFQEKRSIVLILRINILYHLQLYRIGYIKKNSTSLIVIIHIFYSTIYTHTKFTLNNARYSVDAFTSERIEIITLNNFHISDCHQYSIKLLQV